MISKSFQNVSKVAKSSKKKGIFHCEICDYHTSKKYNYEKHLLTISHGEKMVSKRFPNSQKVAKKEYKCEFCDKIYKSNSGLWKHKKICKKKSNKDSINITDDQVILDKDEYIKLLENQGKVINNYNNTNSNNTNNISIQLFLNNHCKDALNIEDFMKQITFQLKDILNGNNYIEDCISNKLIENLDELPVTERPIHCTDQRRKNYMVKDKNEGWIKDKGDQNGKIYKEVDNLYGKAYIDFYQEYDKENPRPHSDKNEILKMETSKKIMANPKPKKVMNKISKSLDIKEAMKEVLGEDKK